MYNKIQHIIFLCFISFLFTIEKKENNNINNSNPGNSFGKIGEFGTLPNPMNDRAKGYLLKGKAQAAITNYGNFINWDHHPAALWGEYTYLPTTAFTAGVPGQSYTYLYEWYNSDLGCPPSNNSISYELWCSEDAFYDSNESLRGFSWIEAGDTNFVSVVFETQKDGGKLGEQLLSPWELNVKTCYYDNDIWENNWNLLGCVDNPNLSEASDKQDCCEFTGGEWLTPNEYADLNNQNIFACDFTAENQWCLDYEIDTEGAITGNKRLIISLAMSDDNTVNPNNANVYGDKLNKMGVGLVYPWAMRPALDKRLSIDTFDFYKYGPDKEEWTSDDVYDYYGFNVAESHFTRMEPSKNAEWQATSNSRANTHNTLVNEGDIFGNIPYLDADTYPLLAHSDEADTWPEAFDEESGEFVKKWPGWFAEKYDPVGSQCFPAYRWNDDCWSVVKDRFISDMDVYMEFDDRWAHRGNMVSNNEYQQKGYPMGLKVMAEAHSYGVSFAEDILFVTVKVRNESGDNWCAFERDRYGSKVAVLDNDGLPVCGDAMVMPDGTKINRGKGFDYKGMYMGFNMDADVVSANKYGSFGVHTNDDDFMEYYDCLNQDLVPEGCEVINDDTLRVSIAMIYDYDFYGEVLDVGIVATQLLDSPYATEEIDLDNDGYSDLYPGDKLKMTDWHWYDWYNRPGVVYREGDAGCCAGDPGAAQAENKEEIMYKIMSGDTTNLSSDERNWYFHTDAPAQDDHENNPNFNPHFDSLDGLELTEFFTTGPEGLDCVLEMSSGPFSLEVGEEVPFSFCIIFGQNKADLIKNAKFAQLMYNSHYQGYTAPDVPALTATTGEANENKDWYQGQHHFIELSWDKTAESSSDVVTGYSDFEGYKIYRSEDYGETWGDPTTDAIFDENGTIEAWKPYAQFHLSPEQDSLHCTFSNDYHGQCTISEPSRYVKKNCFETTIVDSEEVPALCPEPADSVRCSLSQAGIEWRSCVNANCETIFVSNEQEENSNEELGYLNLSINDRLNYRPFYTYTVDCDIAPWCSGDSCNDGTPDIRGFNVCGVDPHAPNLGSDALGKCDDTDGLKYTFIDEHVIDGFEYTYAISAYDMGIAPDIITNYDPNTEILVETSTTANPLGFASPDGYQSIETSKGRTINDRNYVTVTSGAAPTQKLSNNIKVVPNPYIASSKFNETEYYKKIRFINLPQKCKITIFTISGEKVVELNHFENDETRPGIIDIDHGNHWWNLRSYNNQEVAPGLYIYVVENQTVGYEDETFIGKFAIVR